MGWLNSGSPRGEKAVTNYDEDSLTMAVAAATECFRRDRPPASDGVYFATTTAPYRERESAAIIGNALDLRANIRTADFGDSLKAGTGAILAAHDSVESHSLGQVLVCAADCRLGRPGSAQERTFGDAAAAFLLGTDAVIASLEGSYSVAYDFPDHWRTASTGSTGRWKTGASGTKGYTKFIPEAISGLLKKYHLEAKDFARVVYPCLYAREHADIAQEAGLPAGAGPGVFPATVAIAAPPRRC